MLHFLFDFDEYNMACGFIISLAFMHLVIIIIYQFDVFRYTAWVVYAADYANITIPDWPFLIAFWRLVTIIIAITILIKTPDYHWTYLDRL